MANYQFFCPMYAMYVYLRRVSSIVDTNCYCFITSTESSESSETKWSEDALSDLENSPKFVETDNYESHPKRQFKTAEIADALMGIETPIDPSDIESLYPKNVKDFQSGFLPPCAEDDAECAAPSQAADGELLKKSPETEQVTINKASLHMQSL